MFWLPDSPKRLHSYQSDVVQGNVLRRKKKKTHSNRFVIWLQKAPIYSSGFTNLLSWYYPSCVDHSFEQSYVSDLSSVLGHYLETERTIHSLDKICCITGQHHLFFFKETFDLDSELVIRALALLCLLFLISTW